MRKAKKREPVAISYYSWPHIQYACNRLTMNWTISRAFLYNLEYLVLFCQELNKIKYAKKIFDQDYWHN